jgi:hypothetical protein
LEHSREINRAEMEKAQKEAKNLEELRKNKKQLKREKDAL